MASTIILSDNGASSGSAGYKITAGNDGVLILQTTTSGGTATNAVYVDNSQNVGFGVVPSTSAWTTATATNAIQFGARGSLAYYAGVTDLCLNDAGGTYIVSSVTAARHRMQSGNHYFSSAPTGTAGAAITYTDVIKVGKDQTLALQGATFGAGTGVAFPATQNSSTDANTLDDYEEGTWTPGIAFGGGTTGITYANQTGKYTKVGNLVTVQCYVQLSNKGSSTGAMTLTGLPFGAISGSSNYCAVACWGNTLVSISGGLIAYVNPASSFMYWYCSTTGSVSALTANNFSNTSDLMINVTYQAA